MIKKFRAICQILISTDSPINEYPEVSLYNLLYLIPDPLLHFITSRSNPTSDSLYRYHPGTLQALLLLDQTTFCLSLTCRSLLLLLRIIRYSEKYFSGILSCLQVLHSSRSSSSCHLCLLLDQSSGISTERISNPVIRSVRLSLPGFHITGNLSVSSRSNLPLRVIQSQLL